MQYFIKKFEVKIEFKMTYFRLHTGPENYAIIIEICFVAISKLLEIYQHFVFYGSKI